MPFIVASLGVFIVLIGVVGLLTPERFRSLFHSMSGQSLFATAILSRLGIGALLWWAADELRFPQVMRVLAAIAIIAAVGVLIIGRERLDKLVDWWLARSDSVLRASALLAAGFGAFLVYVAV